MSPPFSRNALFLVLIFLVSTSSLFPRGAADYDPPQPASDFDRISCEPDGRGREIEQSTPSGREQARRNDLLSEMIAGNRSLSIRHRRIT